MTALVTLEHVHPEPDVHRSTTTTRRPSDSQIGLVPGERMSVHDLMLAMLLPSADDAAEDLAYNVGHGSVARFVGMMNAGARAARPHPHPLLDADRARHSRQLLERLGPRQAGRLRACSTQPFFRRAVALPSAVLHTGDHVRVRRQPQRPRRPRAAGSTASRPATPTRPGTCWSARAPSDGMTLLSAVLGTPRARRARRQHAGAARLRASPTSGCDTPVHAGPGAGAPDGQGPPGHARARWSPTLTFTRVFREAAARPA